MSLRTTYGEMILKKGTVLYHTSNNKFITNNEKPMLFLIFHPSEYIKRNDCFITRILLHKDVSLLFMIYRILHTVDIHSALRKLIHFKHHQFRKQDRHLVFYKGYLEAENFDGWFSSIDDFFETEVALINNPDNFSVLSSDKIMRDWKRPIVTPLDGNFISAKNWGSNYPISTIRLPVTLNIRDSYKEMLEKYLTHSDTDTDGAAFYIILNNAIINYFVGTADSSSKIRWLYE